MNDVAVKNYEMSREEAIEIILDHLSDNTIIVSTTGMISREVFEQREFKKQSHNRDFLTVGAMGHCSQIALGVSLNTNMLTVCIDGDGSLIMHLGALPIVAQNSKSNFLHIVLNNSAHDSVGGQPTIANSINLDKIADNVGYNSSCRIEKKKDLINKLKTMSFNDGPSFIEVRVKKGARNDLGRPTTKPIENKLHFMQIFK
jgi:phosphonopyruvate decarboxylase